MEQLYSSACAEIKSFLFWLCHVILLVSTVLNPRTLPKSAVFGVNVFQISALLFFAFFPATLRTASLFITSILVSSPPPLLRV